MAVLYKICYKRKMTIEYTHPELGQEVRTFSGYYTPLEEQVLSYDDREVIYILGHACVEASCCGSTQWNYVQVVGFLVRKHIYGSEGTSPVSEIEIIQDEKDRDTIRERLEKEYPNLRIEI